MGTDVQNGGAENGWRPDRSTRAMMGVARWMAATGVAASAWLFAGAEPWAQLLLCGWMFAAGVVYLFALLVDSRPCLRGGGACMFLLALLGYGWMTCVPLPTGLVQATSGPAARNPARLDRLATLEPALEKVAAQAGGVRGADVRLPAGQATISMAPGSTLRALRLLLAYTLVYVVIAGCAYRWRQVQHVAALVAVSAILLALVGIVHKLDGSRLLLWFHEPRYSGNLFATFTNRNHFAAYVNMSAGLLLGVLLASDSVRELLGWTDWRDRLAWFSTRRANQLLLGLFAVLLLFAALVLSVSRGGVVSLLCACGAVMAGAAHMGMRGGRSVWAATGVVALLLAATLWMGWQPLARRLATLDEVMMDPAGDTRWKTTLDVLRMWAEVPLTGSGAGTFRHVFPAYQQVADTADWRFLHAHNDWAQGFAEVGAVGMALFLGAVVVWCRGLRRRAAGMSGRGRLFLLGGAVGLVSIALHSFLDYGLHKPANAFLAAFLAACMCAAARVRRHARPGEPLGPDERWISLAGWRRTLVAAALVGLLLALVSLREPLIGEIAAMRLRQAERQLVADPLRAAGRTGRELIRSADLVLQYAGSYADTQRETAATLYHAAAIPHVRRQERVQLAARSVVLAEQAVAGAPSDYMGWVWLARTLALFSFWDEAGRCMEQAQDLVAPGAAVQLFGP